MAEEVLAMPGVGQDAQDLHADPAPGVEGDDRLQFDADDVLRNRL
jgi:hypothetical protein